MAAPTVRAHERLKRLARYLVGTQEVVWYYRWQTADVRDLVVSVDSDWAGCRRARKSTSGGCIVLGGHALKSWSGTQATVAMSSAEAEYYALVEGAVRGLGLESMMRELGIDVSVLLATDSSAPKVFHFSEVSVE